MIARLAPRGAAFRALTRFFSEGGSSPSQSSSSSSTGVTDVPGLSTACIEPANEPVGPNVDPKKSGAYKTPEYFQYNAMSYFEAEVEMAKYRIPQPSALKEPQS
ncbi:NADH dehydrogenase [ubiquinone] flavoprotein 3, mitochondrial domain-containing protein [Phthorimaea operculella]|nr:NADH dehydrogenase [ubiquinone] flavoprotein 3, mitochondrial domain-containing protein [Phthorimaea operculella]